jgi:hypothetical protein
MLYIQCRKHTNGIPLGLANEDSSRQAFIRNSGGGRFITELHQKQETPAASLSDKVGIHFSPSRHLVEGGLPQLGDMSTNMVVDQIPDNRVGYSTGQRVSTIGAAMIADFQPLGYIFRDSECAKGKTAGDSLGHGQEIRMVLRFAHSKHGPGTAESGLDLIYDQESAVCPTKPRDALQVSFRRQTNTAFPLDRFHNDSSNVTVEGTCIASRSLYCTNTYPGIKGLYFSRCFAWPVADAVLMVRP